MTFVKSRKLTKTQKRNQRRRLALQAKRSSQTVQTTKTESHIYPKQGDSSEIQINETESQIDMKADDDEYESPQMLSLRPKKQRKGTLKDMLNAKRTHILFDVENDADAKTAQRNGQVSNPDTLNTPDIKENQAQVFMTAVEVGRKGWNNNHDWWQRRVPIDWNEPEVYSVVLTSDMKTTEKTELPDADQHELVESDPNIDFEVLDALNEMPHMGQCVAFKVR